jgi:hypothetical protein
MATKMSSMAPVEMEMTGMSVMSMAPVEMEMTGMSAMSSAAVSKWQLTDYAVKTALYARGSSSPRGEAGRQ